MSDNLNGFYKADRARVQQLAKDGRLSGGDWQVLAVAMMRTKNPGDSVDLGTVFLERATGLSRRAVLYAKRHLEEFGYLIPGPAGKRGLSYFSVATGAIPGSIAQEIAPVQDSAPVQEIAQKGARNCAKGCKNLRKTRKNLHPS